MTCWTICWSLRRATRFKPKCSNMRLLARTVRKSTGVPARHCPHWRPVYLCESTSALRARILSEAAAMAADENRNDTLKSRPHGWSLAQFATSKLAMAVAASVLAGRRFLAVAQPWRRTDRFARFHASRSRLCGRTGRSFKPGRVVHIVNEILVRPIADPVLAQCAMVSHRVVGGHRQAAVSSTFARGQAGRRLHRD